MYYFQGSETTYKELILEVLDSGTFDLRCSAGNAFYKALKSDPEMQKQKQAIGKSYEAQRKFRLDFANNKYQEAKKSRTKVKREWTKDEDDAEYCTFSRIVSREGWDKAAWKTSCVWVGNAMKKWSAGKTHKGRAWVKYDSMRNMAVFLHIREKVSAGFSTTTSLIQESSTASSETAQPSSALPALGDGRAASASEAGSAPGTPAPLTAVSVASGQKQPQGKDEKGAAARKAGTQKEKEGQKGNDGKEGKDGKEGQEGKDGKEGKRKAVPMDKEAKAVLTKAITELLNAKKDMASASQVWKQVSIIWLRERERELYVQIGFWKQVKHRDPVQL